MLERIENHEKLQDLRYKKFFLTKRSLDLLYTLFHELNDYFQYNQTQIDNS